MSVTQTNVFLHKQQLRDQNFKEEIIDNHESILSSYGFFTIDEEYDIPALYIVSKLHKFPYKHCYIAGAAQYSIKPLSKLFLQLTKSFYRGIMIPAFLAVELINCGY